MSIRRARPPSCLAASKTVTIVPAELSSTAAASPAQPPPMMATDNGFKSLALDPRAPGNPQLADRRQRRTLAEDLATVALDLVEHGTVDGGHHQPRSLRFAVDVRQGAHRLRVVVFG